MTSEPALREPHEFPLDGLRDAGRELRRPFTPAAVKFKVQAAWPKNNPTGGLIVCYIDARLVVERLNMILPDRWSDSYESVGGGMMWCHLTVDGITRSDIGEGQGKGLVSDALKRAAVKFGVGVSLYATPKIILNVTDGHLKVKGQGERAKVELTPNGEAHARGIYAAWLDAHGTQAFGGPLNHGDVENAAGDTESGGEISEAAPAAPSLPFGPAYDREQMGTIVGAACSQICGGNPERGKQLFLDVKRDCGGYMPAAAALAIIRCAERAAHAEPAGPGSPSWMPTSASPAQGRLD